MYCSVGHNEVCRVNAVLESHCGLHWVTHKGSTLIIDSKKSMRCVELFHFRKPF